MLSPSRDPAAAHSLDSRGLLMLRFDVAGRRLALPGHLVREVTLAVAISALPSAPPIIEGVINVRGLLVPVLDIRRRFRVPARALTPDQHFLIADAGARVVALRVDRVVDVLEIPRDAIEPVAPIAPGAEHVAGLVRLTDGLLVIHDLEAFLSLEEAGRVDAALRHPAGALLEEYA